MGIRLSLLFVLLLTGCNIKTPSTGDADGSSGSGGSLDFDVDDVDLDELADDARDLADQAKQIEICPGQTLEELLQADALSQECRDALLSFLPEPQTTFEGALFAPAGVRAVDGALHVLLQGADDAGLALSAEAFAELEVRVVVDGAERVLDASEFEVALTADLPSELLAVAVVNDYSASMLEGDLRDVAEVETELFECLPPVHETEVIRFSEQAERVLEWSSDREAIIAALAHDDEFDRGTTALLDAMGGAAEDLLASDRPVRILVVSTDGGENASQMFEQAQMLSALEAGDVFVVALGALLADVDFMRDVTRDRGVFFYTREFSALQDAAMPYLESLKQLVELRIAPLDAPPAEVHVSVGELELQLDVRVEVDL